MRRSVSGSAKGTHKVCSLWFYKCLNTHSHTDTHTHICMSYAQVCLRTIVSLTKRWAQIAAQLEFTKSHWARDSKAATVAQSDGGGGSDKLWEREFLTWTTTSCLARVRSDLTCLPYRTANWHQGQMRKARLASLCATHEHTHTRTHTLSVDGQC